MIDIGIGAVMGTILRWLYEAIKKALHLSDVSAAWGVMIISLFLSVAYNIVTGGFAGIAFDIANPISCIGSISAGFAVVYATVEAWWSLTKKRS